FYSAFMVAHKVTIDSLSYQPGAKAVHWESEEGMEFTMEESDYAERGTKITLYLNEDSYEFSNEYRIKGVLEKYCSFMPVPIYFEDAVKLKKEAEEAEKKEGGKEEEPKKPEPVNDVFPLFLHNPSECKEDEYKEFYRKVFHDYKEPLFWIHLNMDYPFNLKGILYFPKINTEYDSIEGTIKLYNSQVFIADNIKEVIPEFLMLLKGVIDCPDIPLNVSRSALQNDGFVKKISDYISKKVADKLSGMYKTERETYEKCWDDICPFIKFGCLKDMKFRDKMKDFIIYKNLDGKYITLPEYLEKAAAPKAEPETEGEEKEPSDTPITDAEEKKEASKKIVYYVTDERQQSQYINMFKESGMDALIMTHNIDQPFITQLEQDNDTCRFMRIDADVTEAFKEETDADELKGETEALTALFRRVLANDKLDVKVDKLKNAGVASVITLSEENRRMQDMMKMYGMGIGMDEFKPEVTLVLNANNSLVQFVFENPNDANTDMICEQLYDLAMLAHTPLAPEAMTKFMERSNRIMGLLIGTKQ
ncbi:MAG: molecular chaperone HtpG, partial [Lachnospiraceae bacterium]|nr:molecular chaperone HtpG [Lachnospiraceae bacterium]